MKKEKKIGPDGVEPERDAPANAALPPIDASPSAIAEAIFLRGAAPRPPEPEEEDGEDHLTVFLHYDNETWRRQMDAAVGGVTNEMRAAGTPDGTVEECILLAIEDIFVRKGASGTPRFFEVLEETTGSTVKDVFFRFFPDQFWADLAAAANEHMLRIGHSVTAIPSDTASA